VSSLQWDFEAVAEWCAQLQLGDIKTKLQEATIDSKHLFMLEASDLEALGIASKIAQQRMLQEIFQLKLKHATGMLFRFCLYF
jgi:hypothetical protein